MHTSKRRLLLNRNSWLPLLAVMIAKTEYKLQVRQQSSQYLLLTMKTTILLHILAIQDILQLLKRSSRRWSTQILRHTSSTQWIWKKKKRKYNHSTCQNFRTGIESVGSRTLIYSKCLIIILKSARMRKKEGKRLVLSDVILLKNWHK